MLVWPGVLCHIALLEADATTRLVNNSIPNRAEPDPATKQLLLNQVEKSCLSSISINIPVIHMHNEISKYVGIYAVYFQFQVSITYSFQEARCKQSCAGTFLLVLRFLSLPYGRKQRALNLLVLSRQWCNGKVPDKYYIIWDYKRGTEVYDAFGMSASGERPRFPWLSHTYDNFRNRGPNT